MDEYGWQYGAGVTYMTIKAKEKIPFYLPTNSTVHTYIFAQKESQVVLHDISVTILSDPFFLLTTPGPPKITSNKNLVIELIHLAFNLFDSRNPKLRSRCCGGNIDETRRPEIVTPTENGIVKRQPFPNAI